MLYDVFCDIRESNLIHIFLVLMVLDILFGVLKSVKNKKISSTVGIDGLIRKFGMILAVLGVFVVNSLMGVNFVNFVPKELVNALNLPKVGLGQLFAIIMSLFEMLSVLANMLVLGIPMPKWLYTKLSDFLKMLTDEKKSVK